MSPSDQRVFRDAAVEHHRQRLLGPVLLPTTKRTNVWTASLLVAVLVGSVGLATGSYPRRQHIAGQLVPHGGVTRLYATSGGVVEKLHVSEGQLVSAGQSLITLVSQQRIANGGSVHLALLAALDARVAETELRLKLATTKATNEEKQLQARLANLRVERLAAERQQQLQEQLIDLTQKRVATLRRLRQEALGSELEVEQEELALLSARREQQRLAQQTAAIEHEVTRSRHALERLPTDTEEALSALRADLARLTTEKENLGLQGGYTLNAPVAGSVAAVHVAGGEGVARDQTLLTILPEGAALQAQFFVPTRAVGFVAPGAALSVMVDAFPYQQFGTLPGTITAVSESVLLPSELPQLGSPGGLDVSEPAYRVVATLAETAFSAYGRQYPLRPGMLISADVVLERRTVLEWLLEPLLSVGRRS